MAFRLLPNFRLLATTHATALKGSLGFFFPLIPFHFLTIIQFVLQIFVHVCDESNQDGEAHVRVVELKNQDISRFIATERLRGLFEVILMEKDEKVPSRRKRREEAVRVRERAIKVERSSWCFCYSSSKND